MGAGETVSMGAIVPVLRCSALGEGVWWEWGWARKAVLAFNFWLKARTGARCASEKQVPRCARNDRKKGKSKSKCKCKGKGKGKSKSKGKGKSKSKGKGKSKSKSKSNSKSKSKSKSKSNSNSKDNYRGPSLRSG